MNIKEGDIVNYFPYSTRLIYKSGLVIQVSQDHRTARIAEYPTFHTVHLVKLGWIFGRHDDEEAMGISNVCKMVLGAQERTERFVIMNTYLRSAGGVKDVNSLDGSKFVAAAAGSQRVMEGRMKKEGWKGKPSMMSIAYHPS